eukprot:365477-Chlamydomonas_euryale.AAC.8
MQVPVLPTSVQHVPASQIRLPGPFEPVSCTHCCPAKQQSSPCTPKAATQLQSWHTNSAAPQGVGSAVQLSPTAPRWCTSVLCLAVHP